MSTPSNCLGNSREAPRISHSGTVMVAAGAPLSKTSSLIAVARRVLAVGAGALRLGCVSGVFPAGSGDCSASARARAPVQATVTAASKSFFISQIPYPVVPDFGWLVSRHRFQVQGRVADAAKGNHWGLEGFLAAPGFRGPAALMFDEEAPF